MVWDQSVEDQSKVQVQLGQSISRSVQSGAVAVAVAAAAACRRLTCCRGGCLESVSARRCRGGCRGLLPVGAAVEATRLPLAAAGVAAAGAAAAVVEGR
jgi:hypothetical protein